MTTSRNEPLEAARQALVEAADALLRAADMEERNLSLASRKQGKAWDGAYVRRKKLAAMEAVRTALAGNIGYGSIVSETKRIEIEEGFTYWTHEGHIMRRHYTGSQFDAIEALGPGGWTEVP